LFREIGDRNGVAEALNRLGEALLADGRPRDARAEQAAALGLASEIGDRLQQARAHDGLARTYQVMSDRDHARRHWEAALALYRGLGVPDADKVAAQLAAADDSPREREREASL
jgi:tetratricopeptide (TPR) repeat protein